MATSSSENRLLAKRKQKLDQVSNPLFSGRSCQPCCLSDCHQRRTSGTFPRAIKDSDIFRNRANNGEGINVEQ